MEDRVFLEVHPDVYDHHIDRSAEAKARLRELPLPIDWRLVDTVLQKGSGIAEEVTFFSPFVGPSGHRLVEAAPALARRDGVRTVSSEDLRAR